MQDSHVSGRSLLTARDVQELLQIDRSTVYRMAEDGRLPSVRVGRTWRFPADAITDLLNGPSNGSGDPESASIRADDPSIDRVAQTAIEVAAEVLGVMMVVTDMQGRPITEVANPCPWFAEHGADSEVLARCVSEWKQLAGQPDLTPRFQLGAVGFECASAFTRDGSRLTGMVLAGGVSPAGESPNRPDLYSLDDPARSRIIAALPRIAAIITTMTTGSPIGRPLEDR